METLYIVADCEPVRNIDGLLARLSGAGDGESDIEKTLGGRTVANREETNRRFRVYDGGGLRALDKNFSLVRKFTIERL